MIGMFYKVVQTTNCSSIYFHQQQYYRDAVNHYYEAYHWANRIVPKNEDFVPTPEELLAAEDDPYFTEKELEELKSIICANCAMAHMMLKNWGFVRDESNKVSLGVVCFDGGNVTV